MIEGTPLSLVELVLPSYTTTCILVSNSASEGTSKAPVSVCFKLENE